MSLCITLDTHIHFDPTGLTEDLITKILSRLDVPNPRKKIAQKEFLYGADSLPDTLELWNWDNPRQLILPRGYIFEFEKILDDNGIKYKWEDVFKTTSYFECGGRFDSVPEIPLRGYQLDAVCELVACSNGIYQAPTGAGKTRVMLELIRQCQQPTIVICEKTDILSQWFKSAEDLNFACSGMVDGYKKLSKSNFIIALRQSILAKKNELNDEWYKNFGTVIIDECHHSQSETSFELIQKFPAYYRFGCSATPDTDKDLFPIARAVIGPVVKHSSREEIGDHLVTPSVRVIKTEFDFPYRPTVREGKKIVRNNYNSMMSSLEKDRTRNKKIVDLSISDTMEGHHCLVVSKRKKHLEEMLDIAVDYYYELAPQIQAFLLTGDNSDSFEEIKNAIDKCDSGTITFSTLADEGTDVPCWDRIFLAYPGRKLRGYEQAIGRIMRPHPKKTDAIVYDFRDEKVSILNSQFRHRCQNLYHKRGYDVS